MIEIPEPELLGETALQSWARASVARMPRATVYQGVGAGLAGLLAAETAARRRAAFLLSEHASYVREIEQGSLQLETGRTIEGGQNPARALFRQLERHLYRAADAITSLYPAARAAQIRGGADPDRCVVVPNGVEARRAPSDRPSRARVRVGYVGRVNRLKGTDQYLDVLHRLGDLADRAEFQLIGPEDGTAAFVEGCRARAETLPVDLTWTARPAHAVWDDPPDLLVSTSRSEAQPFALLEAGGRGIPVVATDVGDCRRLLGEGDAAWGRVVAPGDVDALAEAVRGWVIDDDTRRRAGARAARHVNSTFDIDVIPRGFAPIYRALGAGGAACA